MPTVDPELGEVIGRELAGHGVRLATGVTVRAIHPDNGGLRVLFCLPERVWYPDLQVGVGPPTEAGHSDQSGPRRRSTSG